MIIPIFFCIYFFRFVCILNSSTTPIQILTIFFKDRIFPKTISSNSIKRILFLNIFSFSLFWFFFKYFNEIAMHTNTENDIDMGPFPRELFFRFDSYLFLRNLFVFPSFFYTLNNTFVCKKIIHQINSNRERCSNLLNKGTRPLQFRFIDGSYHPPKYYLWFLNE